MLAARTAPPVALPRVGTGLLKPLGLGGLGLAVVAALYRLNLAVPLNSDQANSLLEAVALRHGNLLLKGWVLPPDTYYTTRIPLLALLETLGGASASVFALSSAILGLALAGAAALVVAGRRGDRGAWWGRALTFALVVSPAYISGSIPLLLPGGSDHAGTLVLVLLAFGALEWLPDRRPGLAIAALLLAVATVGDPLAIWIGGGAIAVSAGIRLLAAKGDWRQDLALLAVVGAAYVVAAGTWHGIHVLGGFGRARLPLQFATADQLPAHAALAVQGILALFGADLLGQTIGAAAVPGLIHLFGLVAVLTVTIAAVRRWGRRRLDRMSEILVAGIVIDVLAFTLDSNSVSLRESRYLLPTLAFGAVLAGRAAPGLLGRPRLRALAAAVLAAYAAIFAVQAVAAKPAPPPTTPVQRFLAARHLTSGLGDYWEASVITAATRGRIQVRAVTVRDGKVTGLLWLANRTWYVSPRSAASFVVFDTRLRDLQRAALIQALGPPAESHRIGAFEVLVWHSNLYKKVAVPAR